MKMNVAMIINLVLKVVAMAMGIVSLVLGFFPKEIKRNPYHAVEHWPGCAVDRLPDVGRKPNHPVAASCNLNE